MIRDLIDKGLSIFGFRLIKYRPEILNIYSDIDYVPSKLQDAILELSCIYQKKVFKKSIHLDAIKSALLCKLIGTSIGEALYIINSIQNCKELDGDICEFGVAQGATSALMAYEITDTSKNIWLYDSFEGLPAPSEKDTLKDDIFGLGSMDAYKGKMSCKEVLVKKKLAEISFPSERTKVVKGFVENTIIIKNNYPKDVCFAYVDFDFYEPIKLALEFLDEHLSPRGIIIVDDYDFFSTGAKTAVDEFLLNHSDKYTIEVPGEISAKCCILKKL